MIYTVDRRDYARRVARGRGARSTRSWVCGTATRTPTPTRRRPTCARPSTPMWWYPIVSLRDGEPMLRAYRIVDGTITEHAVELIGG